MRKLAAIVLLVALAAGAWWAARWYEHKDDLRATVIFKSADELRRGNDVVADAVVIGTVTKVARLDGQDAVSIRVSPQSRNEVRSDSLFSIRGDAPTARLEIDNTIAIGKPIADGAVLYARDDKVARWLADQGKKIAPLVRGLGERAGELFDEYRSETLDEELERLKEQIPEWKKQGEGFAREKLAEAEKRIAEIEEDLRKTNKKGEADKLRAKFEQWLSDAKKKLESDDK